MAVHPTQTVKSEAAAACNKALPSSRVSVRAGLLQSIVVYSTATTTATTAYTWTSDEIRNQLNWQLCWRENVW